MTVENLKTKLIGLTTEGATRLRFQSGFAEVDTAVHTPQHLFIELYTSRYSEIVMAYDTEVDGGISYVTVQRAMQGTDARSWPADTCVRVIEVINGTPCDVGGDTSSDGTGGTRTFTAAEAAQLFEFLTVDDCLELDLTSEDAPKLSIKDTGVTPGDYGGAQVNRKGQLVLVSENWPGSAVPVFDPCNCRDDE